MFDIVSSRCGVYEAKLLVGKTVPLVDATYLHGLEDWLLERYKKFAYQFLNLNGQRQERNTKIDALEEKVVEQRQVLEFIQKENGKLTSHMGQSGDGFC